MVDSPEEILAEWEVGRAGKPLDFPNILFMKIAFMLMQTRLGSKDRHRHLQDIEDTLANEQDEAYRADMDAAVKVRERIYKEGLSDGNLTVMERKEAVDVHHRLWYAAIVRMMKRHGLLGETWKHG